MIYKNNFKRIPFLVNLIKINQKVMKYIYHFKNYII